MLLVSALRQWQPVVTLEWLKSRYGVWRSTINRWQQYFREIFPQSIDYRRLTGRLIPKMESNQLPGALLARFYQPCDNPEVAVVTCLTTLALGP